MLEREIEPQLERSGNGRTDWSKIFRQMDADDRKGMNYLHLSGWVKLESVQFNASGIIFATEFHALG